MELKKLFLLIAIIGMFVFAIPQVLSLFTGQHLFYEDPNSVCGKCHPYIETQLTQSAFHTTLSCDTCHNATLNQSAREGHAAIVPQCMDCHGMNGTAVLDENGISLFAPPAVSFSLPDMGASTPEAHSVFVKSSNNTNTACLSCHTSMGNRLRFTRPLFSDFYASKVGSQFTLNSVGPANTTSINLAGEPMILSDHLFKPISSINCAGCHADVWDAIDEPVQSNVDGQWSQSGHVVWHWIREKRDPQIHNPNNVGTGYSSVSDYCLSSCHRPLVSSTSGGGQDVDPFNQQVHSAFKMSCYYCHNGSATGVPVDRYVFSKPDNSWLKVEEPTSGGSEHIVLWWNIEQTAPGWVQADVCVSCKRGTNYDNIIGGGNFAVYSEPDSLVVKNP